MHPRPADRATEALRNSAADANRRPTCLPQPLWLSTRQGNTITVIFRSQLDLKHGED